MLDKAITVEKAYEVLNGIGKVFHTLLEKRELNTIELIYAKVRELGKETLKDIGCIIPSSFLIIKDFNKEALKVAMIPMMSGDLEFDVRMIRQTVDKMKAGMGDNHQLIGVITQTFGKTIKVTGKDIFDVSGKLKQDAPIPKEDDPNAINTITFELEEKFIKHSVIYKYIEFEDGNIVLEEEPIVDNRRAFDIREKHEDSVGCFFTEGQGLN